MRRGFWVLDYDVLGYTVKNRYEDVVCVEVSLRGWEEKGQIVKKGEIIVYGPQTMPPPTTST